jgi:ABC-type phosphate transport system substrate-binding protein
MYPSSKAIARPEVKAFMEFVVANQADIAEAAKIVPLTDEQVTKAKSDLQAAEQ